MRDYLVLTLTATLGAMGEFAGHERRGTLDWPGRSAILGLVGAALGLRREADFSAIDGLGTAVAIFDAGAPLRDYHTVQTVPAAASKGAQSRPEAMRRAAAARKLNTVLTSRDYRMGSLYGIALWSGPLVQILEALEEPAFTLYLGRKSCPLAAPLAPRIVTSAGPVDALGAMVLPPWRAGAVARRIAADPGSIDADMTELRQDVPRDRQAWHFGPRDVALARVDIRPRAAGEERVA